MSVGGWMCVAGWVDDHLNRSLGLQYLRLLLLTIFMLKNRFQTWNKAFFLPLSLGYWAESSNRHPYSYGYHSSIICMYFNHKKPLHNRQTGFCLHDPLKWPIVHWWNTTFSKTQNVRTFGLCEKKRIGWSHHFNLPGHKKSDMSI